MEEDFFKIGYTTYLQKPKVKKKRWTSKLLNKILEHKVIAISILIIFMCVGMNIWLVYRFMSILAEI